MQSTASTLNVTVKIANSTAAHCSDQSQQAVPVHDVRGDSCCISDLCAGCNRVRMRESTACSNPHQGRAPHNRHCVLLRKWFQLSSAHIPALAAGLALFFAQNRLELKIDSTLWEINTCCLCPPCLGCQASLLLTIQQQAPDATARQHLSSNTAHTTNTNHCHLQEKQSSSAKVQYTLSSATY